MSRARPSLPSRLLSARSLPARSLLGLRRSVRPGSSRRALLKALGASAALAPFLPLLNATGQEPVFPLRLLLLSAPDGAADDATRSVDPFDWRPVGTETDFALSFIHAALEPFKSRLIVPWGLDMTVGGAGQEHAYGMSGMWTAAELHGPEGDADFDGGNGLRTGWGSGPSIDQVVAQAASPNTPYQSLPTDAVQETPYRTLEFGVQTGNPTSLSRMIYSGDRTPIHPEANVLNAYNRVFGGLNMPTDAAAADRLLLEQTSLLDNVQADFASLRTRVSAEEYPKIDAHLEGLLAIERRLGTITPAAGCQVPAAPAAPATARGAANASYPTEITATMDLVAAAFACDLTRVASIQLSRGFSGIIHEWLGHTQGHHALSHDVGNAIAQLMDIDAWYAQQIAYVLGALDAIPEGNGSVLDNTLIAWGREMASTNHRLTPMPVMLAGGARGRLSAGRFLDVDGEPHVKLLVSIGQLMGLEMTSFGNLAPDSGPLAGI